MPTPRTFFFQVLYRSFLPAALFLLLSGLGYADPARWDDIEPDEAEIIVEEMTDTELLGQVLMLGYDGTVPSPEILEWIREGRIGGIKIFGWNVGSLPGLARSIARMQRAASETPKGIPLFIATDQEGGWVRHIKEETSITAGNMAIGATRLPRDAYFTGYYIGRELRTLGVNMNFAPTVDVYTNPEAHVIGPRAFSSDPLETARLAVAYFRGLDATGVIATAKHFPGHGRADVDSHGALPLIDATLEDLWETDLLPYRFLVREGLPAIMGGHLGFPGITGKIEPATLSSYFQTEILRNRLGFEGIAITDDLRMSGVADTGDPLEDIALKALDAGNDVLMISRTPEEHEMIWERLHREMRASPSFRAKILEAAKRILRIKIAYLKSPDAVPLYPDPDEVRSVIPDPEARDFFFELACRSVSLISGDSLPLTSDRLGRVLLAGQYRRFLDAGKARFPEADTYYFSYEPFHTAVRAEKERFTRLAGNYDTVIFCLANPNSLEILETLSETDVRVIVFSVLSPVYLDEIEWADTAIAVYGTGNESFTAGFAVLSGDYEPEGTLPVSIEGRR
ncbi:MAG: glycoside hydrolase family 3 protein [Spirochaetia bacterium]